MGILGGWVVFRWDDDWNDVSDMLGTFQLNCRVVDVNMRDGVTEDEAGVE